VRILFVVEGFHSVGGAQEVVERLARSFVGRGHQVAIVSRRTAHQDFAQTERDIAGIEFLELSIRDHKRVTARHLERLVRNPLASRFGELSQFIARWRPDVVSSNTFNWDTFPAIAAACRYRRVPLAFTLHGFDASAQSRRGLRALRHASALIANSIRTRQAYARVIPEASRAHVLLGAVDLEMAREARPFRSDRPYIFCPGRLDLQYKAFDVAIEAFAKLARTDPSIDLMIAGDGPGRGRLFELIRQHGLGDRVQVIGGRSHRELWPLYKGATMTLITGLGLVLLESLAAGTPVVAAKIEMVPELEKAGAADFMCVGGDAEEVAEAMRRLLQDPATRETMGRIGRERAQRFGWDGYASQTLDVLAGCVEA
jgi:glycosyltransferase involved in cell wall biosynthesis